MDHVSISAPERSSLGRVGTVATPNNDALRAAVRLTVVVAGVGLLALASVEAFGPPNEVGAPLSGSWFVLHSCVWLAVAIVPIAWAVALTGAHRALAALGGGLTVLGWIGRMAVLSASSLFAHPTELGAPRASETLTDLATAGMLAGTGIVTLVCIHILLKHGGTIGMAVAGAFASLVLPTTIWVVATPTSWDDVATLSPLALPLAAVLVLVLVPRAHTAAPSRGTWTDAAGGATGFGRVIAGFFLLGVAHNRLASAAAMPAEQLDALAAFVAAGLLLGGVLALRKLAKAPDPPTRVLAMSASTAAGMGAAIALIQAASRLANSYQADDIGDLLTMSRAGAWCVALLLTLAACARIAHAQNHSGVRPVAIAAIGTTSVGVTALAYGGIFNAAPSVTPATLALLIIGASASLIGLALTLLTLQRSARACGARATTTSLTPHALPLS